jgi:hypothetical protein
MDRTGAGGHCAPPLDPVFAKFVRAVCTMLGVHRGCPNKVCRRANACATRNAVCYQAMEADMQPIVQSIVARDWRRSVDQGEERDVAPAYRDSFIRRLAQEEEEIGRIKSGRYGGDDALTPYQLWLKYWAERCPGPSGGRSRPVEPLDPDAATQHASPPTRRRAAGRTGRGAP